MKFEVVEHDGSEETVAQIRTRRKWKATCLDVVSKEYLYRELSYQLEQDLSEKMFCFIAYLTSARRNEVLAISSQDVSEHSLRMQDGKTYKVYVFSLINEKNKQNDRKYIPVVLGLNDIEDDMIKQVIEFIKSKPDRVFRKLDPTVWNKALEKVRIKARYKERWMPINENMVVEFRLFPHYLRHCRLTHMNWLSPVLITQLAGWSNSQLQGRFGASGKLIDTYIHKNWEALAREMIIHGI